MNRITLSLAQSLLCLGIAATAPVGAVSLPASNNAQALPEEVAPPASPPSSLWAANTIATGSASLVPLMAAEMEANHLSQFDSSVKGGGGASVDDLAFVKQATESGRKEVSSAREALPQLKKPELKRIAEMLVTDHTGANAKLSKIAEAKGWPVPAPQAVSAPPSGTASGDFDAKWTAEMIAGHERSIALYRAQAQSGEDEELRKYARETLPTIERHLSQLKELQK
jgi:predicted outer membrane protein